MKKKNEKTQTNRFLMIIEYNPKYINELKKEAINCDCFEDENPTDDEITAIAITGDNHSFKLSKFYLDKNEGILEIDGDLISPKGSSSFSMGIPLNNKILMDILDYAIKKLKGD